MFTETKIGKWAVRGALLLTLGGIFIVYLGIALDLSTQAYTSKQADFLSYNYERSVVQAPLVTNLVIDAETTNGEVQMQPANFTDWESHVRARLDARYEESEGVSATVYELDFESSYHLTYPGPAVTATVELVFPFPSNLETLHEVSFLVDGVAPPEARYTIRDIRWQTVMEAGDTHDIVINYRADGANSFTYALSQDRRFDALDVQVTVNGLAGSTVPKSALPTTEITDDSESDGERFIWAYEGLVPGRNIRLELPQRLGFAQRLAQLQDDFATLAGLAPFIVGLFLAALAGWFALADVPLRLEGYLLIGVAMTLFYPALTFLSGILPLPLAAAISLLVTAGLILAFLGLAAGWEQTWWRAGWLLVLFLGIFSLSIFTPWTMLLGTLGGVLLVGTFMALYARRPVAPSADEIAAEEAPEAEAAPPSPTPVAPSAPRETHHCPRCARQMPHDFDFCPGCGYDMRPLRTCAACGHEQFVPADLSPAYCQHCGEPLA
ncbi:MAG: hypothetical protein GVY30_08975 [Chloroflexi bacterium]|jgi:hypothetical protein|nr:hypothetical protein [Chloroflexota bacterium]